jgi:hypothetical protein
MYAHVKCTVRTVPETNSCMCCGYLGVEDVLACRGAIPDNILAGFAVLAPVTQEVADGGQPRGAVGLKANGDVVAPLACARDHLALDTLALDVNDIGHPGHARLAGCSRVGSAAFLRARDRFRLAPRAHVQHSEQGYLPGSTKRLRHCSGPFCTSCRHRRRRLWGSRP